MYGYELAAAAADPAHPHHAEGTTAFAHTYGDDVDPADFAPTPFDIDEVNEVLADLGVGGASVDLPGPLEELVHAVRSAADRRRLTDR